MSLYCVCPKPLLCTEIIMLPLGWRRHCFVQNCQILMLLLSYPPPCATIAVTLLLVFPLLAWLFIRPLGSACLQQPLYLHSIHHADLPVPQEDPHEQPAPVCSPGAELCPTLPCPQPGCPLQLLSLQGPGGAGHCYCQQRGRWLVFQGCLSSIFATASVVGVDQKIKLLFNGLWLLKRRSHFCFHMWNSLNFEFTQAFI